MKHYLEFTIRHHNPDRQEELLQAASKMLDSDTAIQAASPQAVAESGGKGVFFWTQKPLAVSGFANWFDAISQRWTTLVTDTNGQPADAQVHAYSADKKEDQPNIAVHLCQLLRADGLRKSLSDSQISSLVSQYRRVCDSRRRGIVSHLLQDYHTKQVKSLMREVLDSGTADMRAKAYCNLIGIKDLLQFIGPDNLFSNALVDAALQQQPPDATSSNSTANPDHSQGESKRPQPNESGDMDTGVADAAEDAMEEIEISEDTDGTET
jgi:hypothetical protein